MANQEGVNTDRAYKVLLFYRFVPLQDLDSLKSQLTEALSKYTVRGRILLAPEGINGTLASWGDSYQDLIDALVGVDARFQHTDWKLTAGLGAELPFVDLFIKVTKELIGTGLLGKSVFDQLEYSEETYGGLAPTATGLHLSPREFHEELQRHLQKQQNEEEKGDRLDDETILLDVRNDIEYQMGHFKGATNLETNYFSESWRRIDDILERQPKTSVKPKIMMYCTGGIRCEKASAYLIQKGIPRDSIYQLQGGIHRYLEEYATDGLFHGKNYVFDERVVTAPTEYGTSTVTSGSGTTSIENSDSKTSCLHSKDGSAMTIAGGCQYCNQRYDARGRLPACTVCRLEVMICESCDRALPPPREYHCKQHFYLRELYFKNLEPFSMPQLIEQKQRLKVLYESLMGHKKKNRRRTLLLQINRIDACIQSSSASNLAPSSSSDEPCPSNEESASASKDFLSFQSSSSWTRATVGPASEWTIPLSESDLSTLSDSADRVITSTPAHAGVNIPLDQIDKEASTLHSSDLALKIDEICRTRIITGRGFVFLKRIPIETWGQQKSAIAFLILSRLMGNLRPQNKLGHVLGHVVDLGLRSDDPTVRLYQTCERQTFHADSADVVSLLCIRPAESGGISSIISAEAIYDEMKISRPDLLERLFLPMATDRRGEVPVGQKPYYMIPVFTLHAGHLNVMYQRQYLDSSQRFPEAPKFTSLDVEALDYFDALADSPHMQVTMQLEPGDIQILYNFNLLHDRSAFQNHPDPSQRRHLLRAWICPPVGRPLPGVFAERFGTVSVGDRGGVQLEGVYPIAQWNI